ncbi:protoporphyrinogen oxidase [Saccharicrinis sp. FJH62]|uniref:protoporphyrinogen oxidase n=1 Tax=Saccharicrinis sp. FJH62 TaxID=3344657 RepID=UPI0035D410CF
MDKSKSSYAVIGGGLTGLTLAFYLKKYGKDVTVLERDVRVGGVINSVNEDGFLFETGPSTGVIGAPELVLLFDELKDKIEVETANAESKNRWIWKNGKWHALPSGLGSAIATPLFSMLDKFRILGEPFRKPGTNPDETVADMVLHRLGRSYLDYAVDPFVSGIYAGDPHKLVTRFALPKLYRLEQDYGSFIKGSMAKHKLPKTELEKRVSREVFSIKGGLKELIKALAEAIGQDNILTGCKDLSVQPDTEKYTITFTNGEGKKVKRTYHQVITTVSGNNLPDLLPFVEAATMKDLSNARYAKVVQAIAGFNAWKGIKLNAFGGLIPSKEKRNALGILFPSSIFAGRAPEGGAVISLFMGGSRKPEMVDMSDEEIKEIVLKEIRETLQCSEKPDLLNIYRYHHAIPQYEASTAQRLEAIETVQQQYPGLILAGNIHDGIGMADRVKQATNLALNLKD